jgi:ATP-dependent exoDNAse (exonuclease V) alpha subunit
VQLDREHRGDEGRDAVIVPAAYVGEHVDYAYARTVDSAQGATVDHSLFIPSPATSAERAYVALSRGRISNRIYATRDHGWVDAIREPRGPHTCGRSAPRHARRSALDPAARRTTRHPHPWLTHSRDLHTVVDAAREHRGRADVMDLGL